MNLAEKFDSIGRRVQYENPGYLSAEDYVQELWVWYLEGQEKLDQYLANGADGERMFVRSAYRVCYAAHKRDKAAALGMFTEDLCDYSISELRSLLDDVFDYDSWQSFAVKTDGPKGVRIEATSDRLASLVDVKSKLSELDERDYNLIIWKWKYGYSDAQLAWALELQPSSIPRTVTRALQHLQKKLQGPLKPRTEGRKAKSNAAARAAVSGAYEG